MEYSCKFADLLYSAGFDSICDSEVYEAQLKRIRSWIMENMPAKLYKYRAPNTNNFNAFENNQLWGSPINNFNDPLECLPCYNLETVNKAINTEFSLELIKPIREQLINNQLPSQFSKLITPEFAAVLKNAMGETASFSDDQIRERLHVSRNQVVSYLNSIMPDLEKAFFSGIHQEESSYCIVSLSETVTSSLMWGHYADSHKGFCLEYDIASILQECSNNCQDSRYCRQFMMNIGIAPVIYKDERFDASSAFISMIMNHIKNVSGLPVEDYHFDVLLPVKTLLTKAESWSYEKEWRLYKKMPCPTRPQSLLEIKPSAAYMGINMQPSDKEKIIKLCQDKQIPCYQMVPQYFCSNYEINPIPINIDAGNSSI